MVLLQFSYTPEDSAESQYLVGGGTALQAALLQRFFYPAAPPVQPVTNSVAFQAEHLSTKLKKIKKMEQKNEKSLLHLIYVKFRVYHGNVSGSLSLFERRLMFNALSCAISSSANANWRISRFSAKWFGLARGMVIRSRCTIQRRTICEGVLPYFLARFCITSWPMTSMLRYNCGKYS